MYPNYHNSILNVSMSILKYYGVKTNYDSIDELDKMLKHKKKHIIYILLDGFGVNIMHKNTKKNSFFQTHYLKPITSVFPPTTVAATTAVLSGLPPYVSGYIGWTQYNRKEDSNTVVFNNTDYYDQTKILKENFQNRELKYESILAKIQKKNPNLIVNELFPDFRSDGYKSFKDQVDKLIEINQGGGSFSYCYWTEPDMTIHKEGIKSNRVKELLKGIEQELIRLKSSIKDTHVILIADHGLIDVKPIDITKEQMLLDCLRRMPSIEPRACAFFVKEDYKAIFLKEVKRLFKHNFILMTRKEFLESNLLGTGEKHPSINEFIGDYMLLSRSKYMVQFKKENHFEAHHAGLTKKEMLVPIITVSR